MAKPRPPQDGRQGDLFVTHDYYPVRRPVSGLRSPDLSLRIKTMMGEALKACPKSAAVVAAEMAEMTGRELSVDALYAYTAPSKSDHNIDIVRFIAFARVTDAPWLWDEIVRDDGLIVMEGHEARLANLGLLQQERSRIDARLRELEADLRAQPVAVSMQIRRPTRGGRS